MLKRPPQRVSFRGKEEIIDLPNLIEIQIKSYNEFLQADKLPHERVNIGLQEVFNEIFPIKEFDPKVIKQKANRFYFVHGSEDPLCDPEDARKLCELIGGTFTLIPGAGHFSSPVTEIPEIIATLRQYGDL